MAVEWAASGERSGLVSIGSHNLFLSASGPDRKPGEPVAIIIQGLACSTKGWAAVYRLLKPFVRTYLYDRSGYGQSDTAPAAENAVSGRRIAAELEMLLMVAKIDPPYILVAHSWGGILSRQFLAQLRSPPDDIAGMVLVDANQERTLDFLDWRDPAIWAVIGNLDTKEVTGLSRNHRLSDDEWREYQDDENSPKHKKQAVAEMEAYAESFEMLASQHQLHRDPPLLGGRPLCVIMGRNHGDLKKLYEAGVKEGNGTDAQRSFFRLNLETWDEKDRQLQSEQLSLSHHSRFVVAPQESGHNVHLTQPELIVDQVRWVLNEIHSSRP